MRGGALRGGRLIRGGPLRGLLANDGALVDEFPGCMYGHTIHTTKKKHMHA